MQYFPRFWTQLVVVGDVNTKGTAGGDFNVI